MFLFWHIDAYDLFSAACWLVDRHTGIFEHSIFYPLSLKNTQPSPILPCAPRFVSDNTRSHITTHHHFKGAAKCVRELLRWLIIRKSLRRPPPICTPSPGRKSFEMLTWRRYNGNYLHPRLNARAKLPPCIQRRLCKQTRNFVVPSRSFKGRYWIV